MLPTELYTPEQVRELDRIAIDEAGIPGERLMERAGRRAFALLRSHWPQARRIKVLCGGGNNAGDGYVVARLAYEAGLEVELLYLSEPHQLRGSAALQAQRYLDSGAPAQQFSSEQAWYECDVIVDALLGTGLDRPVEGGYAKAVEAINNRPAAAVLALDIPSGLHARTGAEMGCAVQAQATVTFVGLKSGLLTGRGPALCGKLSFDGLGTEATSADRLPPYAKRITPAELDKALPPRPRDAHKGAYGHILVVGGGPGMAGAARLAGEAALRCGAGLVSIATRPEHVCAIVGPRPELMVHGVTSAAQLNPLLESCSVLVIGPGLGRDSWARELWQSCMSWRTAKVIDADGLNLLAEHRVNAEHAVLTPHPGEAARLLNQSSAAINADRFAAARSLTALTGNSGATVLKGAGSIVDDGHSYALSTAGNPGMASGGMGDILSGMIGAFLAQGLDPSRAARCGVEAHGQAADSAARQRGERSLLASDLLQEIRL